MMIAGAGREYMPGLGLAFAEHRGPKAFIALSPEGVGDDGFQADSWDTVERPVLMCTGANDGDTPQQRRDPYEHMPTGDQYLLWIEHDGAQHTVFEGDTRACLAATHDQSICNDMQDWLGSGIRAFLDAYLRDDPTAIAYLASDSLAQASAWCGSGKRDEEEYVRNHHSFFGTGPVPGLYVEDYDQALERLAGQKIEWLTETDTAKGRQWRHYRAPDGNVYEVMGPIDPDRSVRV